MKLRSIDRFDGKSDDIFPGEITVTMTIREALAICKTLGQLPSPIAETSYVWDCLTGDVFNRYWDDGVDGADRDLGMGDPLEGYRKRIEGQQ